MSQRKGWLLVGATAMVSLGLMYFAPDSPGHVGLGSLGNAGLLLSVWSGLYLWSKRSASTPGTAAPGERQARIALCAMALIAAYFSWTLYRIAAAAAGNAIDLHEQQVHAMGHGTSLIVIGWLVVASIQRWREPGVIEDERDRAIRASACGASHTVLVLALIGAILLLGFLPQSLAAAATPLLIAHGLIGALILSGLVEHATSLMLYRRDRA